MRMDWIKIALTDPLSDLRYGWDNKHKCIDTQRRVAIVYQDYVVIITIIDRLQKKAEFLTAFPIDALTKKKILMSKKWE